MTPAEAIQQFKLDIKTEFVPFSKSRNTKERDPSLNWRVTLTRDGRDLLTVDYMAGLAHTPAYKTAKGNIKSLYNNNRIRTECEEGFYAAQESEFRVTTRPILPKIEDVIYSLITDAAALEYPTYEEWANDLGYSPDSRSGEKIYRACLEIALKLRAGLGETALSILREAFQDY